MREFILGFFFGSAVILYSVATSVTTRDQWLKSSETYCIEKQFGKETIKKCYDVVEVRQ